MVEALWFDFTGFLPSFPLVPGTYPRGYIVLLRTAFGFTGFYWVLLGFTRFYRVLQGFTGGYWVLLGFYWVLLGLSGFYWVLLGFTGFYWVLLGFTGFYWVLVGFNCAEPLCGVSKIWLMWPFVLNSFLCVLPGFYLVSFGYCYLFLVLFCFNSYDFFWQRHWVVEAKRARRFKVLRRSGLKVYRVSFFISFSLIYRVLVGFTVFFCASFGFPRLGVGWIVESRFPRSSLFFCLDSS